MCQHRMPCSLVILYLIDGALEEGEREEDVSQEAQDAAFIEAMSSLHGKKK